MTWIPPGEQCINDNDLTQVKLAIDRAQLIYGGNGQVSIDSGLLRTLVEAAAAAETVETLKDELGNVCEYVHRLWPLLKAMHSAGMVPKPVETDVEETLEDISSVDWDWNKDVEAAMEKAAEKYTALLGGKKE